MLHYKGLKSYPRHIVTLTRTLIHLMFVLQVLGDVTTLIPDPAAAATTTTSGADAGAGLVAVNDYIRNLYGMGRGVFPGAWGSLGMLVVMTALMLAVSFVGLKWGRFNRR